MGKAVFFTNPICSPMLSIQRKHYFWVEIWGGGGGVGGGGG